MQNNANGAACATDSTAQTAQTEVCPPGTAYPLHRAQPVTGFIVTRPMACGLIGMAIGVAIGIWLSNLIRDGRK